MSAWSIDPATSRLTRNSSPPKPDANMAKSTSLQDRFYPMRISLPSCIQLPEADGDTFEFKPQFINSLSKYHSLEFEDAYFFIREFEEVCLMMMIPQLGNDSIRLHFVPFSFKDLAKKWLCSLAANQLHHGMISSRPSWRNSTLSKKCLLSGKHNAV